MIDQQLLNLPEKQRMICLFESKQGGSVYVYEMTSARPAGLGISQYGRCIKELREDGYNIVNVQPGEFRIGFFRHKVKYEEPVMDYYQLKEELKLLAQVYVMTTKEHRRKIEKEGKELREFLDKMEVLL